MDLLTPHLNKIRNASSSDKVYKDECVYSFDCPDTATGLYVSLTSFIGVGELHLDRHYRKTNESVYVHIKRKRHEVISTVQGDGPEKKITRLAIGVDGGFDPEALGKKYEFETLYQIVVMPQRTTIPWPNDTLPEQIKFAVQALIEAPSAGKLAELEALSGTWDGEARMVSQYAQNLSQLDNGVKIPPSGWQCEKCDKTENLWLNLTDGTILCGRKFYDGTGGNNHAMEHYNSCGYPLAVKLGTITNDGKGDVFSYKEDDMVEDPNLIQHLAHWGINIANMEKTEKSMVELELELNQKSNEWSALQESDGPLKPLYGPGFTGMTNMGNSCYLNSVMQMLFSIPSFMRKYYADADNYFEQVSGDPTQDFNVQMGKIGVGLLSGRYSNPPCADAEYEPSGICPLMFKTLIGRGHPEFSTKKQQDAQEFMLYLLTLLERNNQNRVNPGDSLKFKVEERFQCGTSKKVKYLTRSDLILPLNIPMDAAMNKEEVAAYDARKVDAEKHGNKLPPTAVVRPKIDFSSCLELFTQSEVINNFYSSAVNENVTARKTTKLASFPDYLCIQLKKFMLREDWVPIKLDVSIEMPDILDLSSLRGQGPQNDEELLPEAKTQPPAPVFDQAVLSQLADMGFPPEACKRSVFFTHNSGVEAATQWIMEHIADSDFADTFIPPGTEPSSFIPNSEALSTIIAMGFTEVQATKALKNTDNNMERAMDWIFSHQEELNSAGSPAPPEFSDGTGRYKLVAFISHMGTSTMVGHYVVHILKNDRWAIFNDEKIAASEHPPKDLGYMYLYERI